LPGEEFRQLKLILHSELRRRAASRRALPCPSSIILIFSQLKLSQVMVNLAYTLECMFDSSHIIIFLLPRGGIVIRRVCWFVRSLQRRN